MKKFLLSFVTIVTLGLSTITQTTYNVGDVIPNFTVTDTDVVIRTTYIQLPH
jgi:hypothetical protein